MADINWNLLQGAPNAGNALMQGVQYGAQMRMGHERQKAIAQLSTNRSDPNALAALWRIDPKAAAQFEAMEIARQDRARAKEGRAALGDYLLSQRGRGNALAPYAQQVRNAGPSTPETLAGGGQAPVAQPMPGNALAMPGGPIAPTREPWSQAAPSRPDPYERLVRADPEAALEASKKMAEVTDAQLKQMSSVNATAVQLLGGVTDEASYQAAVQRARALYSTIGVNLDDAGLPEAYSPEAIDRLRMSALETEKQLSAMRDERKLDWEIEDDRIDNAREDRNTTSLIGYRDRSLDVSEGNNRRSTAVSRANNLTSSATTIRRDVYKARNDPKRRGATGGSGAVAVNPTTGEKVRWDGKAWVPVQ